MKTQLQKYQNKLIADRSALKGKIALAAQDDFIVTEGESQFSELATAILKQLNALAICIAKPSLPFANYLLKRNSELQKIVPRDTETRTFLHDIPLIRINELGTNPTETVAHHLGCRKGVILEGVGIIAIGALTVEQSYINWSSVFHATFIKYLEDVLQKGINNRSEQIDFSDFRDIWLTPLTMEGLVFKNGVLETAEDILQEITTVGRYTVEQGLVDSFFGNISCRSKDLIYISQTASSLDNLNGCIDPVPFDNSSTVGITASSELAAHKAIYEQTDFHTILHGHPRFSVIMSMICDEENLCKNRDCWKSCDKKRTINGIPIVPGEIGAGGLAINVPPAMQRSDGNAIVYGHGVFTSGKENFKEAFYKMIKIETECRKSYFKLYEDRWGKE